MRGKRDKVGTVERRREKGKEERKNNSNAEVEVGNAREAGQKNRRDASESCAEKEF
jgi:hypothetical protein